jgi:Tfp pilus assembly protein PilF
VILLCVFAAYLPVLHNGFIWDDDHHVTHNRTLRSLHGLSRIWFDLGAVPQYYPLVHSSFWLEYRLWGLQPLGYHLTNVLLHGLCASLLWLVLGRLAVPGAWFAGLIFGLHPVQVESVAWITERKNVLSGALFLLSLLAYLRFDALDTQPRPACARPGSWYALSLGLFVAALLSKTVACSLPAVILLLAWWKRGAIRAADLRALAPFFGAGLALAGVTLVMERVHVGAAGEDWTLGLVERGLVASRALWFYAGKLVWPAALTFVYPRWTIDASSLAAWAFPLAAAACLVVAGALRERIGRGPLVALLIFAGVLLPALGFFDVYPMRYSFVADHFQYQAAAAPIALICAATTSALRRRGRPGAWLLVALAVALAPLLAGATFRRSAVYRDSETLWRDTLRKNPDAWIAHNNLAAELIGRDADKQAVEHVLATLRLKPDHSNAHVQLGVVLSRQGRGAEAEQAFREALRLDPRNLAAYQNLATLALERGDAGAAIELLRRAIEADRTATVPRLALARIFEQLKRPAEAEQQYRAVLQADPDHLDALRRYGMFLVEQGRYEEAVPFRRRALQLE